MPTTAPTPAPTTAPPETIRLDKWLWHARFCRTRGLAARAVAAGLIRVNAQRVTKPSALVRVGDGLTIVQGGAVRVVRVLGLGARRGPAVEARGLYAEVGGGDAAPAADGGSGGEA